jgi:signal transduction histidine kinase
MRLKLMAAFILVVLVAVTSMVIFVRLDAANQIRTFMFRGGMTGTENLVNDLETYYARNGGWEGVEPIINTGAGMMHGIRNASGMMMNRELQLAGSDGEIIASLGQDRKGEKLTPAEIEGSILLTDSRGETIGYLLVGRGSTFQQEDVRPLIQSLNSAAMRAGLLAGGIGILLALALAAGLIRPIHRLTGAANRLAKGDRSLEVPVNGNDELARLAISFNTMTRALKRIEDERRSMTADIAHELRTPLAVQRAQLEAMQDGIYPLDAEHLQVVIDQTDQLSRLVEDLRTLALSDAGELGLNLEPVNPSEIAAQMVSRFESQAASRGILLALDIPEAENQCPPINADAGRVGQIFNNIINNAMRYSPDGGRITVSLACRGGMAEIRVRDSGEGIPEEALPFVFDRFYRADRARSRQEGGSGLGLAIARQLARAHGGELTAANAPGGGAELTLILPVMPVEKIE